MIGLIKPQKNAYFDCVYRTVHCTAYKVSLKNLHNVLEIYSVPIPMMFKKIIHHFMSFLFKNPNFIIKNLQFISFCCIIRKIKLLEFFFFGKETELIFEYQSYFRRFKWKFLSKMFDRRPSHFYRHCYTYSRETLFITIKYIKLRKSLNTLFFRDTIHIVNCSRKLLLFQSK